MRRIQYPTTFILAGINILVFIWMYDKFGTTTDNLVLYKSGAMLGSLVQSDFDHQGFRLLTSNFVHIGFEHLASNMFSLLLFGCGIEKLMGSFRYLVLYLMSGFGGALAVMYFNPDALSAGASGAIFGLFGAALYYALFDRATFLRVSGEQWLTYMLIMLVINVFSTFTTTGISIPGHIGGLVAGFVLTFVLKKRG